MIFFKIQNIQFVFLIIAITTKDPIFQTIGIPQGYEWAVGLFVSGFGLWKYYLSPLKERVIETEKDMKVVKNDIFYIKQTTDKLEKKFFT